MLIQMQQNLTWPITGDKIAKLETFNQSIHLPEQVTKDSTIFKTVIFGVAIFLIQLLLLPETILMVVMVFQLLKSKSLEVKANS